MGAAIEAHESDGRLLSPREVAARYDVRRRLVYDLVEHGRLPVVRAGWYLLIDPADMERYLAQRGPNSQERAQRALAAAVAWDESKSKGNGMGTTREVARAFGIGQDAVQQGRSLYLRAPDLAERAARGELTLAAAFREYRRRRSAT